MSIPPRSALFLPASNPRAVAKARTTGADAIILDLEDAVAPDAKDDARDAAVRAIAEGGWTGRPVAVRVNGLDSPWGEDDLRALRGTAGPVLLPKVAGPADLASAETRSGGDVELWCMIESAAAVLALPAIAATGGRLTTLILGLNDLALSLGIDETPADRAPFQPILTAAVVAARANGLRVLDGPCSEFRDLAHVEAEARQAATFGFDGKALIHPDQIAPCHRAFRPSVDRIAWARAVVAAFRAPDAKGRGAVQLDGRMVERLHLHQAERVLARAERP